MRDRLARHHTDLILFYLLGLFWGSSFVGIHILVNQIPPFFTAAVRMGIALLALLVIFKLQGKAIHLPRKERWGVWTAGLITLGIPFSLLFWAEQRISAGLGGIMNGTTPLFTVLFLIIGGMQARRPSWKVFVGLAVGFIGILVIFAPRFQLQEKSEDLTGAAAALLMAICYALSNVLNVRLMGEGKKLDLRTVVFHQHASSWVYLIVISLLFEPFPSVHALAKIEVVSAFLYLGVISSAFAMLIHFHLIRSMGAIKTSAVAYVVPVSALLLDYWVIGHQPSWFSIVGIALIFTGLFLLRSGGEHTG